MTQTVAVPVPAPLYQRLERLAHLTNRSLENIVEQALTASLPTIPENLPDAIRDDLLALETIQGRPNRR
jgi:predicted transcriptional regulator